MPEKGLHLEIKTKRGSKTRTLQVLMDLESKIRRQSKTQIL
ncbi:hypothetical protein BT93_G1988 [Corymbia citriodora subsp. variegata]|nr:hypothetical protein BT93_G1988 [Corymbia citriodora subsp. variegata]